MSGVDTSREAVEADASWLEQSEFPEAQRAAAMLRALLAERDEARAALTTARADALREAAALIECGCKNRNEVVAQRPNSAARWNLCEHPNCMAIEVAAILALGNKESRHD